MNRDVLTDSLRYRGWDRPSLAASIDQTLLDPTVGSVAAAHWVRMCAPVGFASLCISPYLVATAHDVLAEMGLLETVTLCSVIGFPNGTELAEAKAFEAECLAGLGVTEFDIVINTGLFKEDVEAHRDPHHLIEEISAVIDVVCRVGETDDTHDDVHDGAHPEDSGARGGGEFLFKAIIETSQLTRAEMCVATEACCEAGVDFVKTSTGFRGRGASVDDIRLISSCVYRDVGIKASGGIHTLDEAIDLLDAGSDRLGCSGGMELLAEFDKRSVTAMDDTGEVSTGGCA